MPDVQMTFIEHLRELRSRLLRSILAIVFFSALAYIFNKQILEFLERPLPKEGVVLQVISPLEGFMVALKVMFYTGIFLALPYVFYQIVMFVLPALRQGEKSIVVGGFIMSWVLMITGVAFGFFVILPPLFPLVKEFLPPNVVQQFTLDRYLSTVFSLLLAFAITFHEPLVIVLLAKMGVVKVETLKKYRRYAIVIIFIVSAIVTPTVDPVTQSLMAIPLIVLYELSIWLSVLLTRPALQEA